MKKKKTILIVILCVILGLVLGHFIIMFLLGKVLSRPQVSLIDKAKITKYVENYLTTKYGDENFKVKSVSYDFQMDHILDYSNPVGFEVIAKSKTVNRFSIIISGLDENGRFIEYDSFIDEYYFSDAEGFERYNIIESTKPKEKIASFLLDKLQTEFDENIQTVNNSSIVDTLTLAIPENFGRIPTMEELSNNINLYEVHSFTFYLLNEIEDEKEINRYENEVAVYLRNAFGGTWNVYYNSNKSVWCIRQ